MTLKECHFFECERRYVVLCHDRRPGWHPWWQCLPQEYEVQHLVRTTIIACFEETSASLRKKQQVEDRTEANAYSAKEWGRALIPLFGIRILVAAAADMECRGDRAEVGNS
ncbi:hypothetical protein CIHG_07717 [Coccidioides immitis H538.4]|uniref:Uncharacterized protein n=3 Tax=Coccidioides immitis TaxID=5501 RepID=A0A0J8TQV0_COCIT|nr:hypothetical protein CIRG_04190 [Coccidioides immitis RMSCC 2394]KMU76087.1 hypothetical protein CISG_05344 [Coccidioides immitis RMSCC 3703]KMU90034.1 hypothetical protein CIHG_07717 [Coccidioides immitis H538.4]